MASPNANGSEQTDHLVQRNFTVRSISPAAPSLHDPVTEKHATVVDAQALEHDLRNEKIIEGIEWILKVLGIAAACVFGAWAPLSYKATLDGNSGNNVAQKSAIHAALAASSQAREAASQQSVAASHQSVLASKQSSALDHMNSRIEAIGQLWLYDFCASRTNNGPCESFRREFPISSLVDYLGALTKSDVTGTRSTAIPSKITGMPTMHTTTFTAKPSMPTNPAGTSSIATLAPTGEPGNHTSPGSDAGDTGSNLALPSILGVVFGGLSAIGLILGIWLFRMKRRSHTIAYH